MNFAFLFPVSPSEEFAAASAIAAVACVVIALVLRVLLKKKKIPSGQSYVLTLFASSGIALFVLAIILCIAESGGPIE